MSQKVSNNEQISLGSDELGEISRNFREIVEIGDRKYGFPPKTYPNCFVGEDAVLKIIEHGMASDELDALRIGNLMLQAGIFHHVQRAHAFKNEYLFYRFAVDEDHGAAIEESPDGAAVKWSDFLGISTLQRGENDSLQPAVPGPDAELANLDQIDLEKVGISPLDEHNAKLLDNVHPKQWRDPEPKPSYNLVVIGAGAGGLVSSAAAAGVGAEVALIESHLLGGD